MPTWTLNNQSLASLGIAGAVLTLQNQRADELTLTLEGSDAGADFTPGSAWDLRLDAVRVFAGRVRLPSRELTGEREGRSLVIEGPWAALERMIYQQRHQAYSSTGAKLLNTYRYHGRIVLGQAEGDDGKINLGQELKRIVAYASGRVLAPATALGHATLYTVPTGADLQLGDIPDGPTPPGVELVDVSCAEAVRSLLRFMPDAVVRFDYSTTPPTLSVARRAGATVRTLPAYHPTTPATPPDPEPVALDISPREDLRVPLVVLKYARGVQAGSYRNPAFWIDYAGLINGTETAAAGWVDDVTDPSPGVAGAMVQTIELADDFYNAVGGTGRVEEIPTGLATALRQGLKDLQYEGRFTRAAAECVPGIRPGDLLNLTGGLTEWTTMKAQIQTVTHDLAAGTTELTFGPAAHLGAADWLELMRANRIGLPGVPKTQRGKTIMRGESLQPLYLTLDRPPGYTESEGATKGWVTWGNVNSVVLANIADSFTLTSGRKVYVKVTTNGAIPLRVLTAEILTTTGTATDSGATASTPATTAYYLLGQVGGAGTSASPFFLTNSGSGNLVLGVVATGYTCVQATAGNPSATPPVPASAGGVRTDYQLSWTRGA